MTDREDVHVGFIVSSPGQLVHFGEIRRHLTGTVSVFVEVRDDDSGLSKRLIEDHLGPCRIKWVPRNHTGLGGECDVIVSHIPPQTLQALEKSATELDATGWRSLTRGLDEQPWPGKAKKIIRRSLQQLPGGDRAVRRYWTVRARRARASPDPVRSELRAEATNVALSEVAHVRRQQLMHLVCAHLTARGVLHRTDASAYCAYIAVRDEDLDTLHTALRSLDPVDGTPVRLWMGKGTHYSTVRRADTVELSDLAAAESIVAGVPFASGSYSVRRNGGVEILLLEDRAGRLVARRARARKADWTQEFASEPAEHPSSASSDLIVREADDLVDVVYTWVDSSDAEWRKRRALWSRRTEILMDSAANDERYLDRDELRYSLRSLALYAPFVRNIHIVTDGHRPSWLVEDDERIRIVPHAQIFPDPSVLPTFNSHAIEACLHRIPGLSDNFLYFNDDVFLGRDAELGDFFTMAGLIKSRFSPVSVVAADRPALDAAPIDWASYNAVTLMGEEFGLRFDRKHKHVPHAMKKSMIEQMEARYPHVFDQTRSSRFRDHTDYAIPSMLAHYYGIATHQAVEWPHVPKEYAYADSGRVDFESRLEQMLATKPLFFCLNVTERADLDFATQAEILQRFLSERFPIPSPWEAVPTASAG